MATDGLSSFVPAHVAAVQYPGVARGSMLVGRSIPSQRQWFEEHVNNTNVSLYRANTRYLIKNSQRSPRRLAPLENKPHQGFAQRLHPVQEPPFATGPGALRVMREQDRAAAEAKKRSRIPWLNHATPRP